MLMINFYVTEVPRHLAKLPRGTVFAFKALNVQD